MQMDVVGVGASALHRKPGEGEFDLVTRPERGYRQLDRGQSPAVVQHREARQQTPAVVAHGQHLLSRFAHDQTLGRAEGHRHRLQVRAHQLGEHHRDEQGEGDQQQQGLKARTAIAASTAASMIASQPPA